MIYTCTLNPAIDLFVEFEDFQPFVVNRSINEDYQANGKAINISFILKKMGIDNTAMGFLGGFTGRYIREVLQEKGIATNFVNVPGITRINTFVRAKEKEYKIVNRGPKIGHAEETLMLEKISEIKAGDMLFVSGSLPRGIRDDILVEIARISKQNGFYLVLDVSSSKLLDCLPYEPYLIKPNDEELAALFKKPVPLSEAEIVHEAEKLLKDGAQNVLVSMGARGAIFLNKETAVMCTAPVGKVLNTACAGDSMLAAFAGSLLQGKTIHEALPFATAVGSSTAFSSGLSDLSDIPVLMKQIQIKELEYKGGY